MPIPSGVRIEVANGRCFVSGPRGELSLVVPPPVSVAIDGDVANVSVTHPDEKRERALWGLTRILVKNMIDGVTKGFSKQLEIHGVGYRAAISGKDLTLAVGFSHPVVYRVPDGITVAVEKNIITVSGIDKQVVGEVAATIRRQRPPEPYKGKGIRYVGERVRQKAGKVVKAAGVK